MKKKLIIQFGIASLIPVLVIGALFLFHESARKMDGGFARTYLTVKPSGVAALSFNNKYFNLVGEFNGSIYLCSSRNRHSIFRVNLSLTDSATIRLNTRELRQAKIGLKTLIDSPFIYQIETLTPTFSVASISDLKFHKVDFSLHGYTDIWPIDTSRFIVRKFDSLAQQDVLKKMSTGQTSTKTKMLLNKHNEGHFSLDGQIIANNKLNKYFCLY